jgi:outer membrane receptor protein involved in Fe transport
VGDETGLIEELSSLIYGNYPRVTSPLFNHDQIQTITEELRLVSNNTGPLSWVAGMWYSYQFAQNSTVETLPGFAAWAALPGSEDLQTCGIPCPYTTYDQQLGYGLDATPPTAHLSDMPADGIFAAYNHTHFHDFAPFYGEITYHITPAWQVTGGSRMILQSFAEALGQQIPICGAACSDSQTDPTGSTYATTSNRFHKQVFKANTSYQLTPDTLVYYTWSQGFRRGGANGLPVGTCAFCVPESQISYQPDIAVNNEIGIKGRLAGGATYTVTAYNINWEHPQINGVEPVSGLNFIGNANTARSRGVESEVTIPISHSVRVLLGYAYTDAIITSNFDVGNGSIVGYRGDRLPGVSKQQLNVAVNFSQRLTGDRKLNASVDAAYRSDFWTETQQSADTAHLPGYTLVNARAGIEFGSAWTLEGYVQNITNAQGISGFYHVAAYLPHNDGYLVARPRTVGINLSYALARERK